MILRCLFIQRYDDNQAPELIVAWDEFSIEENPDGFLQQCNEELANIGPVAGHAYFDIDLGDYDKIRRACLRTTNDITAYAYEVDKDGRKYP